MKRIKCKSTLRGTVAKNGSNIMNGKHLRAKSKKERKAKVAK